MSIRIWNSNGKSLPEFLKNQVLTVFRNRSESVTKLHFKSNSNSVLWTKLASLKISPLLRNWKRIILDAATQSRRTYTQVENSSRAPLGKSVWFFWRASGNSDLTFREHEDWREEGLFRTVDFSSGYNSSTNAVYPLCLKIPKKFSFSSLRAALLWKPLVICCCPLRIFSDSFRSFYTVNHQNLKESEKRYKGQKWFTKGFFWK